jgi:hypothetical protein
MSRIDIFDELYELFHPPVNRKCQAFGRANEVKSLGG